MAKPKTTKPKTAKQLALQEALQVNWELRGRMKNVQIAFLRAAKLLVRMRDEKFHLPMNHPTLDGYAKEHLSLEKSSLYKYLRTQIDAAIEMVKNLMAVKTASFERLDVLLGDGTGGIFSRRNSLN